MLDKNLSVSFQHGNPGLDKIILSGPPSVDQYALVGRIPQASSGICRPPVRDDGFHALEDDELSIDGQPAVEAGIDNLDLSGVEVPSVTVVLEGGVAADVIFAEQADKRAQGVGWRTSGSDDMIEQAQLFS